MAPSGFGVGGEEQAPAPKASSWVSRPGDPYEYRQTADGAYEARKGGRVVNRFQNAPGWLEKKTRTSTPSAPAQGSQNNEPGMVQQALGNAALLALRMNMMKQSEARTVGRALTGDAGEVRDEIHDLWYSTAKESREQIGDGRRGNAWRHHTASQRTAEQYGPLTSFVVGLQHEVGKNLWDYFQGRYKTKDIGLRDILRSNAMDMYNNATGIYDAMTGAQTPTSQMSQLNNDEYNKG